VANVKILVVEDDRKLAQFLRRMLSEVGYTADACASGADALNQARSDVYNLILLDWMIPGMDGLQVCRELRRTGSTIPIVMLTARSELGERVTALNAGVDDYVVKPFEIDEVLARVAALLRRSMGRHVLVIGKLEINRIERSVRLADHPLELSMKEFDLLVQLALNAGAIVSRSKLMEEVWSTQLDTQSHLVDVGINRLRDKLADRAWMIETVRGKGYRLQVDVETAGGTG
jgi:DNA-binding response OmpR family regulator